MTIDADGLLCKSHGVASLVVSPAAAGIRRGREDRAELERLYALKPEAFISRMCRLMALRADGSTHCGGRRVRDRRQCRVPRVSQRIHNEPTFVIESYLVGIQPSPSSGFLDSMGLRPKPGDHIQPGYQREAGLRGATNGCGGASITA